jgi:hypothetical protein
MECIATIAACTGLFTVVDRYLTKQGYQNPYYAIHAAHNALIVATTTPDVINTFTHFNTIQQYPINWTAAYLCYALHLYHILVYWKSFRYDDWLHHGLMIGLALPIGCFVESHTLLGMSLFFMTGLPGGIDYALLFGVRNGYVYRETEKRINTYLNVWIRSPGCAAMAALTLAGLLSNKIENPWWTLLRFTPAALTFWNGQYFMQQVVADSARIGWIHISG